MHLLNTTIDKPFEHASSFTLLANSSINANFAKSSAQIKLSSSSGGQTSFETTFSDIGNTLLISATPDEGKIFKSWEILKSFQYPVEIYPIRLFHHPDRYFSLTLKKDQTHLFQGSLLIHFI